MSTATFVARRESFGYLLMNTDTEQLYAVRTERTLDFSDPSLYEFESALGRAESPERIIFRNSYVRRADILSAPTVIEFNPTSVCNEKCHFCYVGDWLNTDTLQFPKDQIVPFVENLLDAGVFRLIVLGGEPFLYKHLAMLVDTACESGLVVSLSTNGTIDRPDVWERIISHRVHLNVSFHSHIPEIEDAIVGKVGAHRATSRTIGRLCMAGFSPHVSLVVTIENVERVEETVQYLHDLGVKNISLLHTQGSGSANLAQDRCVDFDRYKRACYGATRRADGLNMAISATTNFPFLLYDGLSFNVGNGLEQFMYGHPDGRRVMYVLNDGRVVGTLYQDLRSPEVAGNVLRDRLADVWATSPVLERIRNLRAKESCFNCRHFAYCRGGPTGNLTSIVGDPSLPNCPLFTQLVVTE